MLLEACRFAAWYPITYYPVELLLQTRASVELPSLPYAPSRLPDSLRLRYSQPDFLLRTQRLHLSGDITVHTLYTTCSTSTEDLRTLS